MSTMIDASGEGDAAHCAKLLMVFRIGAAALIAMRCGFAVSVDVSDRWTTRR